MTIRGLARSLDPLPGESLPGYLLRLACRLERSPSRIASLCGLEHTHGRMPVDHLLAIPDTAAGAFSKATRLSGAETAGLGLRCFSNAYPALARTRISSGTISSRYTDAWAVMFSSRYCPACLAGDTSPIQRSLGGPWKLRWHLPAVFACSLHRMLLQSTCPACGNALNDSPGRRTALVCNPAVNALHPLQCRNQAPGRGPVPACGQRLDMTPGTTAARIPGEDLGRMLALQSRFDQWLDPVRQPGWPGHGDGPDPPYFPDLIAASQLIKMSWPGGSALAPSDAIAALIDDHVTRISVPLKASTRITRWWPAPRDTAECGALLLAADTLLGDRDPSSLRDRLQPLARTAFEQAPNRFRAFRRAGFSPVFARGLTRHSYGIHVVAFEHPSLRVPSRSCRFSPDEVPAFIPLSWYETCFADYLRLNPPKTPRHLRRAASLKLAEMTAGGSWKECAGLLGIPPGAAASSLAALRDQNTGHDQWAVFETALEQIACHLDNNPRRINYASRRQALTTWQMPESDWIALGSGIPRLGRMMARKDPSAASVITWAQVTESEHINCPIITTRRRAGQNATDLVNQVAALLTPRNQAGGRLELLRRLAEYAASLAESCDSGQIAAGAR